MGNRVSLHFVNGEEKSVILYSHHMSETVLDAAMDFMLHVRQIHENDGNATPISRCEPDAIIAAFLLSLGRQKKLQGSSYRLLPYTEENMNLDDAGHWEFNLQSFLSRETK